MNTKSMSSFYRELGPGMLFAAQSVGMSHLVQSTRVGGEYGFSLVLLVVIACVIKYPVFRFGIDYANATKTSLLENYTSQGRTVLGLFVVCLLVDMFVGTAAVTLVTAGLLNVVLGIDVNTQYMGVGILVAFAFLLILGSYKTFENITKIFVFIFCICALLATSMAAMKLTSIQVSMFPDVSLSDQTIFFIFAVSGWMPTGATGSVYLSEWRARKAQLSEENSTKTSSIDFDLGYWGTTFLAVCFVGLGAILIYPTGVSTDQSAIGFAKLFFSMFTGSLGAWAFPVVAIAALAVMISSCLALMDACPRAGARIVSKMKTRKNSYTALVIFQTIGASIVLLFFVSSFTSLIDLATTLAFISAPFVAVLNHRAMFNSGIKKASQPGKVLRIWSVIGVIALTALSLLFIYIRFIK